MAQWQAEHPGLNEHLQGADVVEEAEPAGTSGANDTPESAQEVDLSAASHEATAALRIDGQLVAVTGSSTDRAPVPDNGANDVIPGTLGSDADVYSVDLSAGDVLTVSGNGAARLLRVATPSGQVTIDSIDNAGFIYPSSSPLLKTGNVVADHVAQTTGTYTVTVDGNPGNYQLEVLVFRPGFEGRTGQQTIFLDFNGATLDTRPLEGPGTRTLSPLSNWLSRWGISSTQEAALIDTITASVEENLALTGANPGTSVRVLNSKDDSDTFGQADVSRVIVGGSINESGISTIGIAESIDPGNFDGEETALVLLDVLSAPSSRLRPESLNTYLTSRSNRIEFVGETLGNVIAHEIGHFIGSWHTDNRNNAANLMDQGGAGHTLFYGVGTDRVGGTSDDRDVDFGADIFARNEGYLGTENTAVRSGWGLSD